MNYLKKIGAVLSVLAFCSACQKHVVEYYQTPVSEGDAQFQLHYMVPLTAGTTNNINKVELNGGLLANSTASLATFNGIPSGAVGKFYVTKSGQVNLKMYKGAVTSLTLAYDQSFNLQSGKQNVIVHDFNKPPIIIANDVPYPKTTTELTGTTAWVKFYNLMYETAGTPTTLKLQYQFQYTTDNVAGTKSDWLNLGKPVAFGEATGWEPITVNKTVEISQGTARVDYRIRLIGADGSDQGSLQVLNTTGTAMIDYTDLWTAGIGRVYHHFFAGYRTATPTVGVKQFTAL